MLVLDVHLQTLGQQQTYLIWEKKRGIIQLKINELFIFKWRLNKKKQKTRNLTQIPFKALRSLIKTFLLYSQQKIIYNFI